MREAKFVATIFGIITVCLFGGGVVVYNSAPQVSSTTSIVEPAGEDRTISAAESDQGNSIVTIANLSKTKSAATGSTGLQMLNASSANLTVSNLSNKITTTTTKVTTTTTTTTAVVTTQAPEIVTEAPTEAPVYVEPVAPPVVEENVYIEQPAAPVTTAPPVVVQPPAEEPAVDADVPVKDNTLPISESDFIIICNVVGHEAGSNWISQTEKAKVVEVIMNRVNSPLYPNTVYGVISQPNQFSGYQTYATLGYYSGYATESVISAVYLYFADPSAFSHGYLGFYGDGYRNYFY